MTPGDAALLAVAGLAGGAVNAAAGGGSLVTFPALLAVGLSPLAANVTNTVALVPGYLGGMSGHGRAREPLPEVGARA
ncbi:MAG: permease, partial [Frankiales bacterium]|nr:permease [Frankiales bacterium]